MRAISRRFSIFLWLKGEAFITIKPSNFLSFRKSKNGADYKGEKLGKTARWYHSVSGDVIRDINGNKVAGSDGSIPLMEIPDNLKFDDINLDLYIDRTKNILSKMGVSTS